MPKGTKAVKVSDQNKAWNKKAQPTAYRIDSIAKNKTILIVCEGQTEKLYFDAFPVLGVTVKAMDLKGQTKLKLIASTQEIIAYINDAELEVWCVFDMDIKRGAEEFADFDNAIFKARQLGYKVAYSNDCFELWFYLHYKQTNAQHLRAFYFREIGKFFGMDYAKEGKKYNFSLKLYSRLLSDANSSQQNAIARAKTLFEDQKHLPFHAQNPVTTVYELVEELNRNLKR